ncbi:hypothetical protein [Streptomyces sp. MS1.AVA.4]|uniref:Uncharacterized protein n=1 Tax=Streptomyces pratisoli TaxID=3139917 RepID=A0ACC6QV07_9ACTN
MATSLLRPPINPLVFAGLTTVLTLASITCVFAKRRAVRRADTETRAMRAALGLPTERRMRRPATLVTLWGMAAVTVGTGWLVMAIVQMTSRPTTAGEWPEMDRAIDTAVTLAVCFLAAGALHALIQQVRIDREQRRIRNAGLQYLSNDTN